MKIYPVAAADMEGLDWNGGTNHVIWTAPYIGKANLPFSWRVLWSDFSKVDCTVDFSQFAGMLRRLKLMSGRVRLLTEGFDAVELGPESDSHYFRGDLHTRCEILQGSPTAFNLIYATRRNVVPENSLLAQPEGELSVFPRGSRHDPDFLVFFANTSPFSLFANGEEYAVASGCGLVIKPEHHDTGQSTISYSGGRPYLVRIRA